MAATTSTTTLAKVSTGANFVPQMFALPVRGPVSNQTLTVQYQICKKLFWTKDGKTECAYVPASPEEMKAVAGTSSVFTAININSGQKMAVRIPQPGSKGGPSVQQVAAAQPQGSVSRKVVAATGVQKPAAGKVTTIPASAATVPMSLQVQLSPEVASATHKKICLDNLQVLKLNVDKKDGTTGGHQLAGRVIKTVPSSQISTVVTSAASQVAKSPQTIFVGNLANPATGGSSLPQKPIVFTVGSGTAGTATLKTIPAIPITGQSALTGKPIQLILTPGTGGPQNITITMPQGKTETTHAPKPLSQRTGGAQISQTPAKVSAVMPMQRTQSNGGSQKITTFFEPQKTTTVGKILALPAGAKIVSAIQTNTPPAQLKGISAVSSVNANVAMVNPVVPVSISSVMQPESAPSKIKAEDTKLTETAPSPADADKQENGGDDGPMFKIDSVYTLSGTSAEELFAEENKIKIKTEKMDPETTWHTGVEKPIGEIESGYDDFKIRVKEEPPDTGYEKALRGTAVEASAEAPMASTASTLSSTEVASAIVNKCAEIIASNERILASSPAASSSPKPAFRETTTVQKHYVIVTKQNVIPPTPSAITIQKATSPNTMVVTPASAERKPGEPMKWTVVAPPAQSTTEQPSSSSSTTTVASTGETKTIVVHPPGTAMKATKTGMSTYLVKNPTGETTILQFKSAAEKLSEMATIAGNVGDKPMKVLFTNKTNTQTSTAARQPLPSTAVVKGNERVSTVTKIKSEKVESKVLEVTKPLTTASLARLNPTVSLLKVTTPSTMTSTLSSPPTSRAEASVASRPPVPSSSPSRSTRHSAKVAQAKNAEIMTRKRKQDLRSLAEAHLTDEEIDAPSSSAALPMTTTHSPAKRPRESIQDERIRKLKELLKKREAALEQIRHRQKLRLSEDEDDSSS